MTNRLQIQLAGQQAGLQGRPASVNPHHPESKESDLWFHAWHLATYERETGEKILVGAPAPDAPDMMLCRPKGTEDTRDEL